jgi:hypothetical protein
VEGWARPPLRIGKRVWKGKVKFVIKNRASIWMAPKTTFCKSKKENNLITPTNKKNSTNGKTIHMHMILDIM